MKAQMREANKCNADYVIIIGEEELEGEVFIVKDLERGDQKTLTKSEVIKLLKKVII